MWITRTLAAGCCLLALGSPMCGQQKDKDKDKDKAKEVDTADPGPEHKFLEQLVGNFNAKITSTFVPGKPVVSTGTTSRAMILDGRFLREQHNAKLAGKDFQGLALIGYDAELERFIFSWIESTSTNIVILDGTYDKAKKSWTYLGIDRDPKTGKEQEVRDVLRIDGPDQQTMQMFRKPIDGGTERKVMEIVFTRKK